MIKYLVCGICILLASSGIQQPMRFNRQLQREPRFGIIQIDRGDLRDAIHAVGEGIAVADQRINRLGVSCWH
jgi:hypothetical protein